MIYETTEADGAMRPFNRFWALSLALSLLIVLFLGCMYDAASAAGELDVGKIRVNDEVVYDAKSPSSTLIASLGGQVRLALQQLASGINVIFNWDPATKTASFYQPEVHMLTASLVEKKEEGIEIKWPFGLVKSGDKLDRFFVYVEVNRLPERGMEFRLNVGAPGKPGSGEFAVVPGTVKLDDTSGWIIFEVRNARFADAGDYRIQLQVRGSKTNDRYVTIGEKTIVATR